jgi:hypothetical protein
MNAKPYVGQFKVLHFGDWPLSRLSSVTAGLTATESSDKTNEIMFCMLTSLQDHRSIDVGMFNMSGVSLSKTPKGRGFGKFGVTAVSY